ncbi:hypothetical protein EV586_101851 [Tumebacillus sp. BK434]|uniref:uracil-DNA glycosylase family protein n=1 Tax=Tumebacillus sp. BK434 TaxID=2512169 RepID=UPI001042DF6B|nr:uracil-DNA glycosylase family protein [Tumebacillus sp. BK434]TCP59619.1 hypothetical protein EV586_101851 [Tumebacillus sp. BK434]
MSASKQELRAIFNELAKNYLVQDLITEQARFMFLLESPHVQELKIGAPVSGSSGASMTKHLYGEQYERFPLGVLLKKNRDDNLNRPSLNKVALMNVCQIPMQAAAYHDPEVRARYGSFFQVLEGVRSANNKLIYSNQTWNEVQEIIVESLRKKLIKLQEHPLVVVPCGRFAQKFFRLAAVQSPLWQVIEGVPHPSYNGWSKSEYAGAVHVLKAEFAKETAQISG